VRERLDSLIVKRSPLSVPVKKPKATWIQPVVQAEIEFHKDCTLLIEWGVVNPLRWGLRLARGAHSAARQIASA